MEAGAHRYAFGWVPTLEGDRPGGSWEWGGHLSTPRELPPASDDGLRVRCPPQILEQFGADQDNGEPAPLEVRRGDWNIRVDSAECSVPDALGYALLPPLPDPGLWEAQVTLEPDTHRAGFLLRTAHDLSQGYALLFEPAMNRVVLDYWPRPSYQPPVLSRALPLAPEQPIRCQILLSGTVMEAFINDRIVLSARLYAACTLPSGLIVQQGTACFEGLKQKHAVGPPTN